MSDIARYYDESKNPEGRVFGGVPLGDIDEDTWDRYPDHLKASVDASPFYRKTKPAATKAPDKTKDGE